MQTSPKQIKHAIPGDQTVFAVLQSHCSTKTLEGVVFSDELRFSTPPPPPRPRRGCVKIEGYGK